VTASVRYYRDLLGDRERIEAFRRAIGRAVQPGDRVLDVGTGLGTFAFFAAQAGASAVWAVDGDPVVHVAKAIARLNGYDDRVRFVRGWLPDVEIGERVSVVVFEDFFPRLLDARTVRLLRTIREVMATPHARYVPRGARWWAAPVSHEALWAGVVEVPGGEDAYGVDWSASREYIANSPVTIPIPARAVVADPYEVGSVQFAGTMENANVRRPAQWMLPSDTVIHGLAYWFDLDLGEGEWLSNAPGAKPGTWGHLFLPVDPPLVVPAGGMLEATVGVDRTPDDLPSWLRWEVRTGGERRRGHEFAAEPASLGDLRTAAADTVPRLSARGRRDLRILGLADGRRSVEEIARAVVEVEGLPMLEAQRLVVEALRGEILREAPLLGHENDGRS